MHTEEIIKELEKAKELFKSLDREIGSIKLSDAFDAWVQDSDNELHSLIYGSFIDVDTALPAIEKKIEELKHQIEVQKNEREWMIEGYRKIEQMIITLADVIDDSDVECVDLSPKQEELIRMHDLDFWSDYIQLIGGHDGLLERCRDIMDRLQNELIISVEPMTVKQLVEDIESKDSKTVKVVEEVDIIKLLKDKYDPNGERSYGPPDIMYWEDMSRLLTFTVGYINGPIGLQVENMVWDKTDESWIIEGRIFFSAEMDRDISECTLEEIFEWYEKIMRCFQMEP